tara:strand:+ start:87 stop:560 length:474 start_codon:yes stop_codon:yes gene_type:complete
MEYKYILNSNWNLWFHDKKKNWNISGYKNIIKFKYLEEILYFINNYNKIGGLNYNHFILMRESIEPIWEHKLNRDGGCISIKVEISKVLSFWNKLLVYLVSEKLPDSFDINGLSLCIKNPNYSIIQIWLKNKNKNIIDYIYNNIDSNIIYKSYNCEY